MEKARFQCVLPHLSLIRKETETVGFHISATLEDFKPLVKVASGGGCLVLCWPSSHAFSRKKADQYRL